MSINSVNSDNTHELALSLRKQLMLLSKEKHVFLTCLMSTTRTNQNQILRP